jgi:hypothetical protein
MGDAFFRIIEFNIFWNIFLKIQIQIPDLELKTKFLIFKIWILTFKSPKSHYFKIRWIP